LGELLDELDNMELDNMEWKTRSVEAGDGLSKLALAQVAILIEGFAGWSAPAPSCFRFRQWDAKRWVDDVSTELL
jgi:hypothetical protein